MFFLFLVFRDTTQKSLTQIKFFVFKVIHSLYLTLFVTQMKLIRFNKVKYYPCGERDCKRDPKLSLYVYVVKVYLLTSSTKKKFLIKHKYIISSIVCKVTKRWPNAYIAYLTFQLITDLIENRCFKYCCVHNSGMSNFKTPFQKYVRYAML